MKAAKTWERYHLTRRGWISDFTYNYLLGEQPERLLTRQYGEMEEVEMNYVKTLWKHEEALLADIYLVLYPHPTHNSDFENYHKVTSFLNV